MDRNDPNSDETAPESPDWGHWHGRSDWNRWRLFWGLAPNCRSTRDDSDLMRSIADIARSEYADLDDVDVHLECVKVLAMGGRSSSDNASEVVLSAREVLARAAGGAAANIGKNGIEKEGAPAFVRLITSIAERNSIKVTEKAAAQAVSVIGTAGGVIINTIFMDHFQDMARGHFIVLRLEKALVRKLSRLSILHCQQQLLRCLDSWGHVPILSRPLVKARHVLHTLHQPDFSPTFR